MNTEQGILAPIKPHNRLGSTPRISTEPSNKHVLQHAFLLAMLCTSTAIRYNLRIVIPDIKRLLSTNVHKMYYLPVAIPAFKNTPE
jgi:hypothetical protein